MKILLVSVGKKHDQEIADAVGDFTMRISRYAPIEWKLIPSADTIEKEEKSLLAVFDDRDYVVLLDERGKELDSPGLAKLLETRLNASTQRIVFVIGGAFGVGPLIRERAQTTISLSKLVFPHQLVRLILAEQIYRAFTILRGEKYHHAS